MNYDEASVTAPTAAQYHYLAASQQEGLDRFYAFDAPRCDNPPGSPCTMCLCTDCDDPCRTKAYQDGMWYLSLGTMTRYADVVGRRAAYHNAFCFVGEDAVVHLGSAGEPCGRGSFCLTAKTCTAF